MLYCYMLHCKYSLVNDLIITSIFQNSILIEYILLNNFLVCMNIFVLSTPNVLLH